MHPTAPAPTDDVRRELARVAVRESTRLALVPVPVALALAAGLRHRLPAAELAVWLAVVVLDTVRQRRWLARAAQWLDGGGSVAAWRRRSTVSALLTALPRTGLAILALRAGDAGVMNLALVVMAVIAAIAAITSPFRSVYAAFLVGLSVPSCAAAVALGGDQRLIGGLGLVFVPTMLAIQLRFARTLTDAVQVTHTNRTLAAQLADEHARLAEANERLVDVNAQLAHRAAHDPLTGLANRTLAMDRLTDAVRTASPTAQVAVIYADLDGFKQINDTLGHQVGDHVLVAVARRLAGAVTGEDLVARLGGDEFVVVVRGLGRAADAAAIGRRLLDAVSVPVAVDGRTVTMGVSIGVATADQPCTARDLVRAADAALYRAKGSGRGRVEVTVHRADQGEQGAEAAHRKRATGVATPGAGITGYTAGTPSGNR